MDFEKSKKIRSIPLAANAQHEFMISFHISHYYDSYWYCPKYWVVFEDTFNPEWRFFIPLIISLYSTRSVIWRGRFTVYSFTQNPQDCSRVCNNVSAISKFCSDCSTMTKRVINATDNID